MAWVLSWDLFDHSRPASEYVSLFSNFQFSNQNQMNLIVRPSMVTFTSAVCLTSTHFQIFHHFFIFFQFSIFCFRDFFRELLFDFNPILKKNN